MRAVDVLEKLIAYSPVRRTETVDTVKFGDGTQNARRIAFCFTATPNVLSQAKEWGADVIVTHEPTYYDHFDNRAQNELTDRKLAAVTDCNAVIMRYHDHMHACVPDLIHKGFIQKVGLNGVYDGERAMHLDNALTISEIASLIKNSLGLDRVKIIGKMDMAVRNIALCLGACGDACQNAALDGAELVIAGEISEWRTGEQFRDMAEFGMDRCIMLIGHCTSEKAGMQYLAERFAAENPDVQCRYIDCGDIYTYI